MQIVQYPSFYSSAFDEIVFHVSAEPDELLEIDILANDQTTVIGKKRFTGSARYQVNIAGYARRQLEVAPLRAEKSSLMFPSKRTITVMLRSGDTTGGTFVAGGVGEQQAYEKLSKSPGLIPISASQRDELSLILDEGIPLRVEAKFFGTGQNGQLTLVDAAESARVTTLCLNMPDIGQRLQSASLGTLNDYHTMEILLMCGTTQLLSQRYRLVKDIPGQVRLCWWNYHGQIDYYTMQRTTRSTLHAAKNRIYTQGGYKTVRSRGETTLELVSAYEPEEMMRWISDMIASPRVWIDRGTRFEPVEIISDRVVNNQEGLSRLEIQLVSSTRTIFQNL